MDYLTIFAIAAGLCFDTFAVSLSFGVVQHRVLFLQAARLALILAIFQGGLTVAGFFLGSMISAALEAFDHWVALGLLAFLGGKMIIESFMNKEEKEIQDYNNLAVVLMIAVGTSIDAFAIGISFALLDVRIWISGMIIAAVTFIASMAAIRIGKSAGKKLGKHVEIAGGLILLAIGVKIFLEHIHGGT